MPPCVTPPAAVPSGPPQPRTDGEVRTEAARRHLDDRLLAASRGDISAFEELYDALSPRVYGLVVRILRDVQQSEEVAQEVMLELWRTSSRFDPSRGSTLAWVMTIAHRRAVDRVRSTEAWRRRDTADVVLARPASVDDTVDLVHASLEATTVRAALASLSECQRQALELAYFGGYTHAEISRLLQVPLGTAKTRIRDGLRRLRDTLPSGMSRSAVTS